MKLKSFQEFIAEKQANPELVKKMAEEVKGDGDNCPRCGKPAGVCICTERDYGSTVNLNRLGKGEKVKNQNGFKKTDV